MDELTKLELNRRLTRLSNSDLLSVITIKKHVQAISGADRQKPLQEEIEFATQLYSIRMGLG